jgi:clathrin heavy chain
LYIHYDEYDNAALTMINHSADAWEHPLFKDVLKQVHNIDICYRAVQFYTEEQPLLVNDLLAAIRDKIDHTRVVSLVRKLNHLPLIKAYMTSVQEKNIPAVNDALHDLYIEEEDYEALRSSVDRFDAFDIVALAQRLEKHDLLEFRRIAAVLYKVYSLQKNFFFNFVFIFFFFF